MTKNTIEDFRDFAMMGLEESGLTLDQYVVRSLKYPTAAEGRAAFERCITEGCASSSFYDKLRASLRRPELVDEFLNGHPLALQNEGAEEAEALEEQERACFRPHVAPDYVQVLPCRFKISDLLEGRQMDRLELPTDVMAAPRQSQLAALKPLIQQHYARNSGLTGFGARIDAYRFFYEYDDWLLLDINGEPIPEANTPAKAQKKPNRPRRPKRRKRCHP